MDYRIVVALLGIALSIFGYYFYFRDIIEGKTKPHAFSWFVWALLEFISFGIILTAGGGAGAWINASTGLLCLIVTIIGLKQKYQIYTRLDWTAFTLALMAIGLWLITDQPVLAIILVAAADNLAFLPTFRKSYHRPREETISLYLISMFKYILSLLALTQFSFTTVFYQSVLIFMNGLFVTLVFVRRHQLASPKPKQL